MYRQMRDCVAPTLIVASPCHTFRQTCRDAFTDELFPGLRVTDAASAPSLLLACARLRQACLLIDPALGGGELGDLIDMLHGGGFSGPIVAASGGAKRLADTAVACLAHTVALNASPHVLRQALAPFLGIMGGARWGEEEDGAQPRVRPLWLEEKRIIEAAIRSCGGNVGQAARALEISPSTIYRKMQSWQTAG